MMWMTIGRLFRMCSWLCGFFCSFPLHSWSHSSDPSPKRCVAIAGTSDIHGQIEPTTFVQGEDRVRRGGALAYAGYIELLRQRYGHRLLVLDAGDLYQGTMLSNETYGQTTQTVLEAIGVQATTIGNHEFDYGGTADGLDLLGILKHRIATSAFPFLSCNIYSKATHQRVEWTNLAPSMHLHIDGLDIGILGVSSEDTTYSTHPANITSLQFTAALSAVQQTAAALREQGADIVILLAHIGAQCHCHHNRYDLTSCFGHQEDEGELIPLLQALPKGLVDVAIGGHTHHNINHYVNDTLAIQTGQKLEAFSWLELCVDEHKRPLVHQATLHEQIPLCLETWADGTCTATPGGTPTRQATFLEQKVAIPQATHELIADDIAQILARAQQPIKSYVPSPLQHIHMAALAAEAFRKQSKTHFGLYNFPAVRHPMPQGDVHFGALYQSFPFQDVIMKVHLTGRQIQQLAQVLGYDDPFDNKVQLFAGLKIRPNEDQQTLSWFHENKPLQLDQIYTLATTTFLLSGGDGTSTIFQQVPDHRIEPIHMRTFDTVVEMMEHLFPKI